MSAELLLLAHWRERYGDWWKPIPKPLPPNPNLLAEAIADAKAVRAIALAKAKELEYEDVRRAPLAGTKRAG